MAQTFPRYCPRCGAPIATNSRSCANCGLPVEAMLSRREQAQPVQSPQNDQDQQSLADQQTVQQNVRVQPGHQPATMQSPQADQQAAQYIPQPFQERDQYDQSYSPAQKIMKSGRKRWIPLVLALIVLLGAIGYIIAGLLGSHLPGFRGGQTAVTTKAINATVPYAGVDITILNVQQSQTFLDDPNSSDNGMVRLNLREQNTTGISVSWSYDTIARLILPDKSLISPAYVKATAGIAPGTSQASLIDFVVPTSDTISQLTLRLGAQNEAQILIPLTGKADLSKYQPKSIDLSGQMLYFGLNWTLTSATSSLSLDGQQASRNMRYLTLTLKVDNTLSQTAITGSPYDYMRLGFGNTTASPMNTTLPVSFDRSVMGKTGTVSFLVPQNIQSFTLLLIPQKQDDNSDQASTDFQLAS
jgi:zinc-ribbon domain